MGCAYGYFLDEARRDGWMTVGVEPSGAAADSARTRLGLEVHDDLSAAARQNPRGFDVVCFFQVLEHLRDPELALRHARMCLKPGGLLCIETWDNASFIARTMGAHWQQVSPPTVLHLFSRKSLLQALASNDFASAKITTGSKRVSFGFVAGLLAGKGVPGAKAAHALLGRANLAHRGIPYRLGDLISVTARAV